MGQTELAAKVRELKELRQLAEELAAQITGIEDEIKEEMRAREVDELTVDVFKIRWTKVVSTHFDTKAFKTRYGEIYAQFARQIETRRFSVA